MKLLLAIRLQQGGVLPGNFEYQDFHAVPDFVRIGHGKRLERVGNIGTAPSLAGGAKVTAGG